MIQFIVLFKRKMISSLTGSQLPTALVIPVWLQTFSKRPLLPKRPCAHFLLLTNTSFVQSCDLIGYQNIHSGVRILAYL